MIIFRLFAAARELAGKGETRIPWEAGETVASAWAKLCAGHPSLERLTASVRFAVNQEYAPLETPVSDDDEIAVVPPVSGGEEDLLLITEEEIDTARIEAAVRSPGCGAVATFLGTVRDTNEGKKVLYLEYEAYRNMAIKMMGELAQEARGRWGVHRVAIAHRIGRLEIGEASVFIAVASPHRAEAFDACRYAIDELKRTVPIWKKEVREDGEFWGR
ncbi:MAG: molybdenum cofactor biosynthesis protein MoaE [Armatimonadetes bacterium]|nr:molybdenum cofactor biosynthesis protein MoaE [Armatimonadota bacterium]